MPKTLTGERAEFDVPGFALSEHERAILRRFGRTWEALDEGGRTVIRCLVCRRVSFHPDDLRHLYCGACARHHEERERAWRQGQEAEGPERRAA